SPGHDLQILPGVAQHELRVEQRLGDPVELSHPRARRQPAQDAAEGDEADAVASPDVAGGEGRGRADGQVERARGPSPRVREGVEEEDDVGVALWMPLVYPKRAAPGADAPVDVADGVAVCERTQVGELDPGASPARDLVAREDLRLSRSKHRAEDLLAGENPQRR